MKSKVIRIIIVLCFVGMVAFGVIVLINNINVETKAYSQIAEMRNNAEFDNFYIRADKVQSTAGGDQCSYTAYTNKATILLNEGIDYYLVYLQDMDGMNRNDMNKLVKGYKAYIAQYNKAKRALNQYENVKNNANAQTQVASYSATFGIEYLLAYGKGYTFFMDLQNMVDKKVFDGKMFKSFTQINYEMSAIFVNNSKTTLVSNLEKKKTGGAISTPYANSTYAKNFDTLYKAYEAKNKVSIATELKTPTHAKFISDYNELKDVRAFLTDATTYIASNPREQAAVDVKTFLTATYSFNLGGSK